MKRTNYSLFLVLGASLLLSLQFCPPFDKLTDDREFFQYTGMAILKGQVPYRDFFDHKPPLFFFINSAGLILGNGPWGLWLISTGLALLISFLLFRAGRQYKLPYPWLLPLLFNLMIRDFLIVGTINLIREYSTFFVMLFFCAFMSRHRLRFFLLGFLTALVFFTQQEQVFQLIPFLLYALFVRERLHVSARIVRVIAGFLPIPLLLILYFAIHGSFHYFWEDAYVFNVKYYIQEYKSIGDHFRSIKRVLDEGNYEMAFMVSIALAITCLIFPHRKKGLLLASLIALFLSLSSEWLGGRQKGTGATVDVFTYFVPLAASVCMVLFIVFAYTEARFLTDRFAQLPYALLLCCSLTYTNLQHLTNLKSRADDPLLNSPEINYLKQQQLKDYQLCVLFDTEYTFCYNELKVLAPSPWIYQHFWLWYPQWDPGHQILDSIAGDLLRHHTTYIIMPPKDLERVADPGNRARWTAFMQAHYERLSLPGSPVSFLWRLKENNDK
jgi:hypothetical protein